MKYYYLEDNGQGQSVFFKCTNRGIITERIFVGPRDLGAHMNFDRIEGSVLTLYKSISEQVYNLQLLITYGFVS